MFLNYESILPLFSLWGCDHYMYTVSILSWIIKLELSLYMHIYLIYPNTILVIEYYGLYQSLLVISRRFFMQHDTFSISWLVANVKLSTFIFNLKQNWWYCFTLYIWYFTAHFFFLLQALLFIVNSWLTGEN